MKITYVISYHLKGFTKPTALYAKGHKRFTSYLKYNNDNVNTFKRLLS